MEGTPPPAEECGDQKEYLTIDQVVDKIYTRLNFKLVFLFLTASLPATQTALQVYMTIFTGFIPYSEWTCVSTRCFDLYQQSNYSETFYSAKGMCSNKLEAGKDFNWTSPRTSFSMDWNIYCETESKLSVISSFFFIGASLGLLCSSGIFDRFGRKNGALAGNVIAAAATLSAPWLGWFEAMLAVRVLQGFGMFINLTGVYCWVVEFSPSHVRGVVSPLILAVWCSGFVILVGISYFIPYWKYIFLTTGALNLIMIVPFLVYPISPRFALVRGREKEAKKILERYARACNSNVSFERTCLDYTVRVQNFWEQIKDFKTYPTLRKQTLLCLLSWFTIATLFYGFDFGWGKISDNLYVSYLLAALGKLIAILSSILFCQWLGRKNSTLLFLVIGLISFILAMPDVTLGPNWTLQFVACLLGNMTITAAYAVNYLYTGELAPTSHRGMVMSMCSSCARVGSFLGIYIYLLHDITDRRVPLAIFAALTLVYITAVLFLSDTSGKRIPETPYDVELLAGNEHYKPIQNNTDTQNNEQYKPIQNKTDTQKQNNSV